MNDKIDYKKGENEEKFQWKSRSQHVLFFVTYVIDWGLLSFLMYERPEINPKHVPTLLHYLVVIIILGRPMIFFQTFVGQYTRRGCIFIGEMIPIAYGLGYSMLLVSFAKFIFEMHYTLEILSYTMSALINLETPWMVCSETFTSSFPNCFQKSDIDMCPSRAKSDKTCFEPHTKVFAASLYKKYHGFLRHEKLTSLLFTKKLTNSALHLFLMIPLLLIFAVKGSRSFSVTLKSTMILCVGGLISILIVVISRPGSSTGLYTIVNEINFNSLLDLSTWEATVRRVIIALRLTEGGHFLFGSFIPELLPDNQRTLYLGITFFFVVFSIILFYHLVSGLLIFKLNMDIKQLDLESGEDTVFVTYPMVLGVQASSYFFSAMFFLVFLLLGFHSLVLKVFVIQKTIAVQFNLKIYLRHIKCVIILVASIITLGMKLTPHYKTVKIIENEIGHFQICLVPIQILVLFIYGFQRINDDVQFYSHSRVKVLTILCWLISLGVSTATAYLGFKNSQRQVKFAIRMSVCAVFCLPFVIFFLIKIFTHIRKKNIIGLLRPSDLFGPPDVERRIQRILYNPRLTIKSKGHEEICYHNCLLKSSALKIAVHEEIELIKKFITDLQASKSDLKLDIDIISQLKIYENILLKELGNK